MTIKRTTRESPHQEPPVAPQVLTVGQLTQQIRESLETGFASVSVQGEISQWKQASSGHTYFTLKDETAVISAVIWKGTPVRFSVRDGISVLANGRLTLYPPRGSYQLVCSSLTPLGQGDLQIAFEQLKARLLAEGLFDPSRKRTLPEFPRRIGVVTSRGGAVIHDIITTLRKRMPSVGLLLRPALVQGAGAAEDIAQAIGQLNAVADIDVIIVGRGGGSLEDLWAFNEEATVRAIAASRVPVISAVGHETDFTMADFVADARAATPTAAVSLAVRDRAELLNALEDALSRMSSDVEAHLEDRFQELEHLAGSRGISRPLDIVRTHQQRVDDLSHRVAMATGATLRRTGDRVSVLEASMRALNPVDVLRRGYAIIERGSVPVSEAASLRPDDTVTIRMHDGTRDAVITG